MNFDLKSLQKKGETGVNSKITYLIGGLIVIVLAVALAPSMFEGLAGLNTTATGGNIPTWVPTVLVVIVGAGLVFLIWKAFGNK